MAIVVTFDFPNKPIDDYHKVFEIGGDAIINQPARLSHVCVRQGDGFRVIDVWTDEQSFAEFGAVIGPILEQLGLSTPPKVAPAERFVAADGGSL